MWRLVGILAVAACSFEHGTTPTDGARGDGSNDGMGVPIDVAPALPGVIARWEFDAASGTIAADTSNVGTPLDLTIDVPTNTEWSAGALSIKSDVHVRSAGDATKIIDACKLSGAITVEAWVTPADNLQGGPARIITISPDILNRDVMLGQEGATYVMRLRTPQTDLNGVPTLGSGSVIGATPALAHVVLTGDATDRTLYVDGVAKGHDTLGGSFAGWTGYPAIVANEEFPAPDRAWRGMLHRIVVYDRALSASEITTLFTKGL